MMGDFDLGGFDPLGPTYGRTPRYKWELVFRGGAEDVWRERRITGCMAVVYFEPLKTLLVDAIPETMATHETEPMPAPHRLPGYELVEPGVPMLFMNDVLVGPVVHVDFTRGEERPTLHMTALHVEACLHRFAKLLSLPPVTSRLLTDGKE
jgi:hypothetical protein